MEHIEEPRNLHNDWTARERFLLTLLSQHQALRLDHLERFLALFEGHPASTETLVPWHRAARPLVARLQQAGLIHLHHLGSRHQWLWLTQAGMRLLGPSARGGKRPARRLLPELEAYASIRLHLSEQDPHLRWLSWQSRRTPASPPPPWSPPVLLETSQGERIALRVALRLSGSTHQLMLRLRQQLAPTTDPSSPLYHALWYYASPDAAKRLRAARARLLASSERALARHLAIFTYPLRQTQVIFRDHHAPVLTLAFSPDGRWIASAGEDQRLFVWEAASGHTRWQHPLSAHPCTLAWSQQGTWIALGDQAGSVSIVDAATGQRHLVRDEGRQPITALAWSPLHEEQLAWGTASGQLQMNDVQHNALLWGLAQAPGGHALAFSPDGNALALGGNAPCVHLLDASTGRLWRSFRKHCTAIRALAWSPDGSWLASASAEASVLLWHAASGKKRRTIHTGLPAISVLALSVDGSILACAGSAPIVQVWEVATGRLLLSYEEQGDTITALAFSPDGRRLTSACGDGSVHVFAVRGEVPS